MKATLVDMEKPWLNATLHCKWATSYAEAIYTLKYQGLSRTGLFSNQPPDFQYLSTGFVRYLQYLRIPTHTYMRLRPLFLRPLAAPKRRRRSWCIIKRGWAESKIAGARKEYTGP